MKIQNMINKLEKLKAKHGNVHVFLDTNSVDPDICIRESLEEPVFSELKECTWGDKDTRAILIIPPYEL